MPALRSSSAAPAPKPRIGEFRAPTLRTSRRSVLVFASVALVSALASAQPASPPPAPAAAKGGLRYTIGVTKFENHSNFSGQFAIADTWSALLTEALQRSGRFIVLGESDMRAAALSEQDLARSGRTATGDKAPATGNLTPAQLLVKGEITHFQPSTSGGNAGIGFKGLRVGLGGDKAEINIVIYVVDSTTGQVVASRKVVGEAKSGGVTVGFVDRDWNTDLSGFKKTNVGKAIEAAIDDAVTFITAQIPNLHWSGTVVLVRGNQVYINRGEREGVTAGQLFQVGSAEILRDPGTGETLDVVFTPMGEIRVDTVREKTAICSIVSGEGLQTGMSVSPP
jgi:curli biogenesis system outer membrane secretion channel CsgG